MRKIIGIAMLLLEACTPSASEPTGPKATGPTVGAAAGGTGPTARIEVPPLLRGCAVAPAPPPIPRTIEQVLAWAADLSDSYADCAYRLKRLNVLLDERS